MGKGHTQRPAAISQAELEHNWFVVFGEPEPLRPNAFAATTPIEFDGEGRPLNEFGEPVAYEPPPPTPPQPFYCPCGDHVEHDHF